MNAQTQQLTYQGSAGVIQALLDTPSPVQATKGTVIIAHPHPLFGGTMQHKVVQTVARAFVQCGWAAVRFNFRGVGTSAGQHDDGRGELEDLLAVVQQAAPTGQLALAGFSFGAFVASHALSRLEAVRAVDHLVMVGPATSRFTVAEIAAAAHLKTLVIHGEEDDTVPLQSVLAWARPQALPVTVVPGCGHFFHGQLPLLKSLVVRHIGGV